MHRRPGGWMDKTEKRPLTDHLDELRVRLIRCSIAVAAGFVASYAFKEKIFSVLMKPLLAAMNKNGTMIFTGLPEAFFTYLKTAFIAGLLLASPVIIYQFWMFIAPGLYKKERRALLPAVILSVFFFTGGALFGYFIVFPFGFRFFLGFATGSIQALPSMREYLAFSSKLLLPFGVVFELPIVVYFLTKIGLLHPAFMRKYRKHALIVILIVAAIITPTSDIPTLVIVSLPLYVLFEASIFVSKYVERKK